MQRYKNGRDNRPFFFVYLDTALKGKKNEQLENADDEIFEEQQEKSAGYQIWPVSNGHIRPIAMEKEQDQQVEQAEDSSKNDRQYQTDDNSWPAEHQSNNPGQDHVSKT